MNFPPLYPIANLDSLKEPRAFIETLLCGGVEILQLRAKTISDRDFLEIAKWTVEKRSSHGSCKVIINDRSDICKLAAADGVHLGQDDAPPQVTRDFLGPNALIGLSTHSREQLKNAPIAALDYLAFGPVFLSSTKQGHAETQGLEHLRSAAETSPLPLVAIGGIDLENAKDVYQAGASSVAVISALGEGPQLEEQLTRFQGIIPKTA